MGLFIEPNYLQQYGQYRDNNDNLGHTQVMDSQWMDGSLANLGITI